MTDELRPCPFCGGDAKNDDAPGQFGESVVRYGAKCRLCGASMWHPEAHPEEPNWNTRPVEDALVAALAHVVDVSDSIGKNTPDMNGPSCWCRVGGGECHYCHARRALRAAGMAPSGDNREG